MIELASWSPMTKLLVLLGPFVIGIPGLVIHWQLASARRFEETCRFFEHSRGLKEDRALWGSLFFSSRAMIVGGLTTGMVFPAYWMRQGWLDAEDYRNIPQTLKIKMQISFWTVLVSCVWLAINYCLLKCPI